MTQSPQDTDPRNMGTIALLTQVVPLLTGLIRGEAALARAELSAKARQAVLALAGLVLAVVLVLVGLQLLAAALVALLMQAGLAAGPASLLVGLTLLLIAGLLIWRGLAALSLSALLPRRTAHRIREDAQHISEVFRHD